MKLSNLIEKLQEVHKEYGDVDVIYSIDPEGNAFHKVYYEPTPGTFIEDGYEGEFIQESSYEEYLDDPDGYSEEDLKVNSVCIN